MTKSASGISFTFMYPSQSYILPGIMDLPKDTDGRHYKGYYRNYYQKNKHKIKTRVINKYYATKEATHKEEAIKALEETIIKLRTT